MMMHQDPMLSGGDVIEATGGFLFSGSPAVEFAGISTDSRKARPGDLFIPLAGEKYDGHDFLPDAVKGGASGVLFQKDHDMTAHRFPRDVTVILVKDTLTALGDLARWWRNGFTVPVVAITGSAGKTTTKEMVATIVERSMNIMKSPGNFNNLVGLPLSLFQLTASHEAAVVELGTNRKGEIRRLTEIALPDIGIITAIGAAHLEGFGTIEEIRKEKTDLFRHMKRGGIAIFNADDRALQRAAEQRGCRIIRYGVEVSAEVRAEGVESRGREGIGCTLDIEGVRQEMVLPVIGRHQIYSALAAASAAWVLGIDRGEIWEGLKSFRPVTGRMEAQPLRNGAYLVDDTYNANPLSVREALAALRDMKGRGRTVVIFGDMLELGDRSEYLHEQAGEFMAETGVDRLFVRGGFSESVMRGARRRGMGEKCILCPEDPRNLAEELHSFLREGDWVLVKGSRGMRMDRYVQAIVDRTGNGT